MLEAIDYFQRLGFMFGAQCVGFSTSREGWKRTLLAIAETEEKELRQNLAKIFQSIKSDELGRGLIFYFPQIEYPKDFKLTEDDLLEMGFVEIRHEDLEGLGIDLEDDKSDRFYAQFSEGEHECLAVYAVDTAGYVYEIFNSLED